MKKIMTIILLGCTMVLHGQVVSTPAQIDSVVQGAINKGIGAACVATPTPFTASVADQLYNPSTDWVDGYNSNFSLNTTTGELTYLGGDGLFMFQGNSECEVSSAAGTPVVTYSLIRTRGGVDSTLVTTSLEFTAQDRRRPFSNVRYMPIEQGDVLRVRISSNVVTITITVDYLHITFLQVR